MDPTRLLRRLGLGGFGTETFPAETGPPAWKFTAYGVSVSV